MFEEFVAQKLAEAAARWSDEANERLESEYLTAARNWALNKAQGVNAPMPEIPQAIRFTAKDGGITAAYTGVPVSQIQPTAFLPTYKTDIGAVGGAIGGPIQGQPGKFYAASGSNPQAGDVVKVDGSTYVYKRPTPFGGYWEKV